MTTDLRTLIAQYAPKAQKVERIINDNLVALEEQAACFVTGLFGGFRVLAVGPKGAAKSKMCDILANTVEGATYFVRQCDPTMTKETLLGPIDYEKLEKEKKLRYMVDLYLPGAHIVQLDEVGRSSPTVLDSLLTVLNEKFVDNGDVRVPCKYLTLFGTSNQELKGEYVEAVNDRFQLRTFFPAADAARNQMIYRWARQNRRKSAIQPVLTLDELREIQAFIPDIPFSAEADRLAEKLIGLATDKNIPISGRRVDQVLIPVLQTRAFIEGEAEVTEDQFYPAWRWALIEQSSQLATVDELIGQYINAELVEAQALLDEARAKASEFRAGKAGAANDPKKLKEHNLSGIDTVNYLKSEALPKIADLLVKAKAKGKRPEKFEAIKAEIESIAEAIKQEFFNSMA